MANISDIIEKFILDAMQQDDSIQISRNELANFFSCAPSQINYVLATRFSNERGYEVYSQRGGGGYIRLTKLTLTDDDIIQNVLKELLNKPIDYSTGKKIVLNLFDNGFFSEDESKIIISAIMPKALACPINFENQIRTQILKNVLINKIKSIQEGGE